MAFIGLGVNAQTQNAPKKELENCKFDATGSTYSLTGVDVVPNTNAGELYNRAFNGFRQHTRILTMSLNLKIKMLEFLLFMEILIIYIKEDLS